MSRLADRLSHSEQLRTLREQAETVMGAARPAVQDAAETARHSASEVRQSVSDPVRRILDYLPTILDLAATFRTRSGLAVEAMHDAVPTRKAAMAYVPSRPAVMSTIRPVLLGMVLATAGYAAYRYTQRRKSN